MRVIFMDRNARTSHEAELDAVPQKGNSIMFPNNWIAHVIEPPVFDLRDENEQIVRVTIA